MIISDLKKMNKKALVTGGSRGIGKAVSDTLANNGYIVDTTAKNSAATFNVDFASDSSFEKWLEVNVRDHHYDVVVNNVGINIIKPVIEVTKADIKTMMDVNLTRAFQILSALSYRNPSRIVNMASVSATYATAGRSLYCTTKHALAGLTRAAALDLAPHGALVNSVSPGPILTELTTSVLSEEKIKDIEDKIPLGRLGNTQEVADLVMFLVSNKNTYITGQNFIIDGGLTTAWM